MTDIELNPQDPEHWQSIMDRSGYSERYAASLIGLDTYTFNLYMRGERKPRENRAKQVTSVIARALQVPRIPFHPSYGFATPEQFKALDGLKIGPAREKLERQIHLQTLSGGKTHFVKGEE